MKTCPNCRMETRPDADWCWHCGYSYEEADARNVARANEQRPVDAIDDDREPVVRVRQRGR